MSAAEQLTEIVRAIVREELARQQAETGREQRLLYTVPEAARLTSISSERLRLWIEEGRIPRRVKNPHAKRPVYLVSVDEIKAASEGPEAPPSAVDLSAARILRRSR